MNSISGDQQAILEENMDALYKCAMQLRFSLDKCLTITPPFSAENLESIEALTSRFARTADVLTHKAVKSLVLYLSEDAMTFIDTANFLEKIRVATSFDDVIRIRELRNEIAHEYSNRDTEELLHACLTFSPTLFGMMTRLVEYVHVLPRVTKER